MTSMTDRAQEHELLLQRARLRRCQRDAERRFQALRASGAALADREVAMRAWLSAMNELIELEIRLSLLRLPVGETQ